MAASPALTSVPLPQTLNHSALDRRLLGSQVWLSMALLAIQRHLGSDGRGRRLEQSRGSRQGPTKSACGQANLRITLSSRLA